MVFTGAVDCLAAVGCAGVGIINVRVKVFSMRIHTRRRSGGLLRETLVPSLKLRHTKAEGDASFKLHVSG